MKIKEAFFALKRQDDRGKYENYGHRGRFRFEKPSSFDKKVRLVERGARKFRNSLLFLAILSPFLFFIFRYFQGLVSESKGYSLRMHYKFNYRYKTPANSFTIFVQRDFLQFEKSRRWNILERAEVGKIEQLEKECMADKMKIENLQKKIEDRNDILSKANDDIKRIESRSACSKLPKYRKKFLKIFKKSNNFFEEKSHFEFFTFSV